MVETWIDKVINNGMEAMGTYICKEVEVMEMEMEIEANYRHKVREVMKMVEVERWWRWRLVNIWRRWRW